MTKLLLLVSFFSLLLGSIQIAFSEKIKNIEHSINKNVEWGEDFPFTFSTLTSVILILAAVLLFFIATNYKLH